eukprot:TRINITY_DN13422_c0_g2_i6.p1 TRINITY_DN13422_c0_g2~~TRINITY_DN13422_c0_g2_i6.p1  ORF type:complete len:323 (+),score=73.46 TRINITY_DN13422_c0_g2_i6:35-970(+)
MSDWECSKCTCHNLRRSTVCDACGTSRYPPGVARQSPIELPPGWRCAEAAGKIYYYHNVTKQRQWNPPEWPINANGGSRPSSPNGVATVDMNTTMVSGSTQAKEKWSCRVCTVENFTTSDHCTLCGSKRNVSWQCDKCTLENPPTADVCEVCGHRPSSQGIHDTIRKVVEKKKDSVQKRSDPLQCPMCTYTNKPNWSVCEVCEFTTTSPLPRTASNLSNFSFDDQAKEWSARVAEIEKHSDHFIDETFPPSIQSIYGTEMCSLGPADTGSYPSPGPLPPCFKGVNRFGRSHTCIILLCLVQTANNAAVLRK